MDNKEYQEAELKRFWDQKHAFFDTVKEFSDELEQMDLLEQIEWIENGSYGAGACFALQNALKSITWRCNARARIGGIVLHAFYGKLFSKWPQLSKQARDDMDAAVDTWLKQEHSFAMDLEV